MFARRRTGVGSTAAGELGQIGALWSMRAIGGHGRMRAKMVRRQRAAVQVLMREQNERWDKNGASFEFVEHVLPHLPATRAQRQVLVQLAAPEDDGTMLRIVNHLHSDGLLPQGQVLAWIDDLRGSYASGIDPASDPLLLASGVEIGHELRSLSRRGHRHSIGARRGARLMESARTMARMDGAPGFPTPRDFLIALDRDGAESSFEREDDGRRARALVMRAGEWSARRIAEGRMTDITYADLGLDPTNAGAHTRQQMEHVRSFASTFPLADTDGARQYLRQVGLTAKNLGVLAPALSGDDPDGVAIALAWGVKEALESSYGTAIPDSAQTDQVAAWLRSAETAGRAPIATLFLGPSHHHTALRLAGEAQLARFAATASMASSPSEATASRPKAPPRRALRPLRNLPPSPASATPVHFPEADAPPSDTSTASRAKRVERTPRMPSLGSPRHRR